MESLLNDIYSLATEYPRLASWKKIGKSWEKESLEPIGTKGYDIVALKLTNKHFYIPSGSKPKLLMNCGIHGREYITSEFCLSFAEEFLRSYNDNADATWVLDYHEIHLIVVHNPDGRKRAERGISWRKNANCGHCSEGEDPKFDPSFKEVKQCGADLNRNFDFKWRGNNFRDYFEECSIIFAGDTAASEPETKLFKLISMNYLIQ